MSEKLDQIEREFQKNAGSLDGAWNWANDYGAEIIALARQRDALLEAAKAFLQSTHPVGAGDGDTYYVTPPDGKTFNALRAAIRACEEE
jgi:hypothetical protein